MTLSIIQKDAYCAVIGDAFAGSYATSTESTDKALKAACREFVQSWKPSAGHEPVGVRIYAHDAKRQYIAWDERGTFIVDRETDEITAYAVPVYFYDVDDVRRPLTTCRMRRVHECFVQGEKSLEHIADLNAARKAPIGTKFQ